MAVKKTAFMKWVDRKIVKDASLRRLVEENLAEMRIEQELAALRERRGDYRDAGGGSPSSSRR